MKSFRKAEKNVFLFIALARRMIETMCMWTKSQETASSHLKTVATVHELYPKTNDLNQVFIILISKY